MQAVSEYPAEGTVSISREVFASKGPFYRYVRSPQAEAAIRTVLHWAGEAVRRDERWIRDVDANGRIQRLKGFRHVHEILHLAEADLARYAALDRRAAARAQHTRVVHTLPDGAVWVQLLTREAFVREGMAMRHCLGNGHYYRVYALGRSQYFSLRDASGRSRVTLEARQGLVVQVRAACNADPWPRWRAAIEALMQHMQWRLFPLRSTAGFTDGPEQVAFRALAGDLDLDAGAHPAQLAERLQIGGSLRATGRDWLTSLPDTLWVEGDCIIEHCVGLVRPPRLLLVHGKASFAGCASLGPGFDKILVAGDLDLRGCAALERLPERMHVGGRLDITDAGLRALPAAPSVGGPIVCGDFATKSAADMTAHLMRLRRG
ncbi:MAG: PcfJ domain-containing protein [Hyphomicrobiaceae bacterium]|nr:PcfJ domain-containing protein [Hyphomicrobiaceae bacterium]